MALVPTKSDVFVSSINHLLCVSTASEIVILGFVLTDPSLPMSPTTQGKLILNTISSISLLQHCINDDTPIYIFSFGACTTTNICYFL